MGNATIADLALDLMFFFSSVRNFKLTISSSTIFLCVQNASQKVETNA